MNPTLLTQLGDELYTALTECRSVPPLTSRGLDLSVEDAYHIQLRMIERRLAAGEKIIGKKIGVTSRAVQTMLNVNRPDFGHLLSGMVYQDGDTIPMKNLILPRAEGEIAFVLKRDLTGPGVTAADVMAATEGVMACFEIVDSRIDNWQIKIQDTVADNASCGVFVLGDKLVDPATSIWPWRAWCWKKMATLSARGRGRLRWGTLLMPWRGWPIPWASSVFPSRPAK